MLLRFHHLLFESSGCSFIFHHQLQDRVETSLIMNGKAKDIPSSSTKDGKIHIERDADAALAESWLGQVETRFHSSDKRWQVSKNVCIHRVPKPMRIFKPEVFNPLVVSLGPFHHKMNHKLSKMDEHKIEAVHRTLARLKGTKKGLTDLRGNIRDLDNEIRGCYEEPIHLDGETVSWLFAMDGCFILEFFRTAASSQSVRNHSNESGADCFSFVFQKNDRTNAMYYGIMNDIMKMENQIPFVVLKSILKLEFTNEVVMIVKLCEMLLQGSNLFKGFPFISSSAHNIDNLQEKIRKLKNHVDREPAHLLDLYRMVIEDLLITQDASHVDSASHIEVVDTSGATNMNVSNTPSTPASDDSRYCSPSAELLHTAGVKFEPGPIRFRKRKCAKAIVSLPQIRVDDSTVTLLRNVTAYEECQRCSVTPKKAVVSQFLLLLEYLIDSAKDVSVLRKARVISSFAASDKDVASRFDNMNQGITGGTYDAIEEVMKKAREHYDSQWNVWISQIQEERCSRPWYLLPVAAGLLLLVMTAVQTVFTVLQYKKQ